MKRAAQFVERQAEVEQSATNKKRAATLKETESEAEFIRQQAEAERAKAEAQADAERMKAKAEAEVKAKKDAIVEEEMKGSDPSTIQQFSQRKNHVLAG